MNDQTAAPNSVTRRSVLATFAAAGTAAVAGCGYQPGPGEHDWTTRVGNTTPFSTLDRRWLSDGSMLVAVRNRSGRTYDHETGDWVDVEDALVTAIDSDGATPFSGSTERQYEGAPALGPDGVYIPLVDGGVSAMARGGEEHPIEWTTELGVPDSNPDQSPIELSASATLVVWTQRDAEDSRLVALESDSGEVLFDLTVGMQEGPVVTGASVWIAGMNGENSVLRRLDDSGDVRTSHVLPGPVNWIQPVGDEEGCVIGIQGSSSEVRAVSASGETRWSVPATHPRHPPSSHGGILYVRDGGDVRAVKLDDGELLWERSNPFTSDIAVGSEGVFGFTTTGTGCELGGLDYEGELSWTASLPEDAPCGGTPYAIEDRVAVVSDARVDAYRAVPGRRYAIR